MYMPASVLKTLKTPEALRFEQTRRALKQVVADAKRKAAQHTRPFKHPHIYTAKEQRDWELYLNKKAGLVSGATIGLQTFSEMPHLKNEDIEVERQRRYDLTLAYQDALIAHPAKLAALRLAEQAARIAYTTHLNTEP